MLDAGVYETRTTFFETSSRDDEGSLVIDRAEVDAAIKAARSPNSHVSESQTNFASRKRY